MSEQEQEYSVEDIVIPDDTKGTTSGIIRVEHNRKNPYTMISQAVLEDAELSWEARGMLGYLLSKPNDWTVRFTDLVRQSPAGATKTRRIFKEIEAAGHIVRTRTSRKGRFIWTTTVYEVPITRKTIYRKPIDGKSIDSKSIDGKPEHIISTDLLSTDLPSVSVSTQTHSNTSSASTLTRAEPAPASPKAPSKRAQQNAIRKAVGEHFQEVTHLKPPATNAKALGRLWWSPIREICVMAEWDVNRAKQLISSAVIKLEGMTISDPNSILKTCRALAAVGFSQTGRAQQW